MGRWSITKIKGVNVQYCDFVTKNIGARSEHHDGRDRVTKNIGDVRARLEHCDTD